MIVGRFAERSLSGVDGDFLRRQILLKGRVIQLHDDIARHNGRSFGDDLQDANALGRRDLAPQFDVRGAFQLAPLDDVGKELAHDRPLRRDLHNGIASHRVNRRAPRHAADRQQRDHHQRPPRPLTRRPPRAFGIHPAFTPRHRRRIARHVNARMFRVPRRSVHRTSHPQTERVPQPTASLPSIPTDRASRSSCTSWGRAFRDNSSAAQTNSFVPRHECV